MLQVKENRSPPFLTLKFSIRCLLLSNKKKKEVVLYVFGLKRNVKDKRRRFLCEESLLWHIFREILRPRTPFLQGRSIRLLRSEKSSSYTILSKTDLYHQHKPLFYLSPTKVSIFLEMRGRSELKCLFL